VAVHLVHFHIFFQQALVVEAAVDHLAMLRYEAAAQFVGSYDRD